MWSRSVGEKKKWKPEIWVRNKRGAEQEAESWVWGSATAGAFWRAVCLSLETWCGPGIKNLWPPTCWTAAQLIKSNITEHNKPSLTSFQRKPNLGKRCHPAISRCLGNNKGQWVVGAVCLNVKNRSLSFGGDEGHCSVVEHKITMQKVPDYLLPSLCQRSHIAELRNPWPVTLVLLPAEMTIMDEVEQRSHSFHD